MTPRLIAGEAAGTSASGEPTGPALVASTRLSVIVPTRNEPATVGVLAAELSEALSGVGYRWEVVFVDDSDDNTPQLLAAIAHHNPRVRVQHRSGAERVGGLAGAVLAGFAAAAGDVLLVMDGDLQHPPTAVPLLAAEILAGGADIVIGSRYVPGGSAAGLGGPWRLTVSRGAGLFARLVFAPVREVRDPLAGFFAVRRSVVCGVELAPDGFKILLEILLRGRWSTLAEVPIVFLPRAGGESKAGVREGLRFLRHVHRLRRGGGSRTDQPSPPGEPPLQAGRDPAFEGFAHASVGSAGHVWSPPSRPTPT